MNRKVMSFVIWTSLVLLTFSGLCVYGVVQEKVKGCLCKPGLTGQYCENELFDDSSSAYWSGQGRSSMMMSGEDEAWTASKELCNGGEVLYDRSCVCNVGYTGPQCDVEMIDYSGAENGVKEHSNIHEDVRSVKRNDDDDDNKLIWKKSPKRVDPYVQLVTQDHVVDGFVKVSTGLKGSGSSLSVAKDALTGALHYKFDFRPTQEGRKSRLELSTCFVTRDRFARHSAVDVDEKRLDKNLPSMLQHWCPPVADHSLEAMHKYSYRLLLKRDGFPQAGSYILAQWHGTSDGRIVRDEAGCVARLSDQDLVTLCRDGTCKKGMVMDESGTWTGLRYEQGGYPPLTFHYKDGTFYVVARSDEREFIAKSGCHPGTFDRPNFRCPLHPRQQYHVLWSRSLDRFPFDRPLLFTWKIKWSEYGDGPPPGSDDRDGGMLLSNAWVRLWIDGEPEVDWKGPCGRNDDDRVPYFKMGIYNPSGSMEAIELRTKDFTYSSSMLEREGEKEEREEVEKLRIHPRPVGQSKHRNTNELRYGLTFGNANNGTGCTLSPQGSALATIASLKYLPLKSNKEMAAAVRAMADVVLEQQERIRRLESELLLLDYDVDEDDGR